MKKLYVVFGGTFFGNLTCNMVRTLHHQKAQILLYLLVPKDRTSHLRKIIILFAVASNEPFNDGLNFGSDSWF